MDKRDPILRWLDQPAMPAPLGLRIFYSILTVGVMLAVFFAG
ncbi:hypothetical protein [Pseudomonas mangiferae]|nr:hypothetical protein [Pseudomonas mangiferae]